VGDERLHTRQVRSFRGEGEVGEAGEEGGQGDPGFEAGEGRPDAVVDAVAEGQVVGGGPAGVECGGIGAVVVGVVACGGVGGEDRFAGADRGSVGEGDVGDGEAQGEAGDAGGPAQVVSLVVVLGINRWACS
jgi:hypothetical protein